ncbi:TVP38/TMEM64 family protein [Pseudoruegeria aquimaris]|nr:TVP38/TMEM64 family protein [Pseudoruegeria aquimaris]
MRAVLMLAAMAALTVAAWLWFSGAAPFALTRETVAEWVARAGLFGPLLVIGLMMAAVVASPIPSAPIAVAAGAAYGHGLGTVLVAIGAELGALIAFLIARWLGHDALRKWFGERLDMGLLGSQNVLMVTVFTSRLMPFVSFDMISYAAGLTRLHLWRFAVATLAGILPASFVLAHLGGEIAGAEARGAGLAVIGLGLLTGAPLLWLAWKRGGKESPQLKDLSQINAERENGSKLPRQKGNRK